MVCSRHCRRARLTLWWHHASAHGQPHGGVVRAAYITSTCGSPAANTSPHGVVCVCRAASRCDRRHPPPPHTFAIAARRCGNSRRRHTRCARAGIGVVSGRAQCARASVGTCEVCGGARQWRCANCRCRRWRFRSRRLTSMRVLARVAPSGSPLVGLRTKFVTSSGALEGFQRRMIVATI